MFYILLCLQNECCGIDMLEQIPAMTGGRVHVGSGTLYNLLEQFVTAGFIRETRVEGRRRSYLLTDEGRQILRQEYERLQAQVQDYERCLKASGAALIFPPGQEPNRGKSFSPPSCDSDPPLSPYRDCHGEEPAAE